MAKLSEKVQDALDEARILVLGVQVLIGFDFRAFFDPGFDGLPPWARAVKLAGLCLQLLALCLVIVPGSYHRLAENGEDTEGVVRVTSVALALALLPFAVGLGADTAVGTFPVAGGRGALALGGAVALVALLGWYGLTGVAAARRHVEEESEMTGSSVDQKIRHVLTEARMVLPGAQALIGFQLAVTLHEAFRELPREVQWAHVAAILLTTLAVVLLMTPAAYHRMVEHGELSDHFHRVATALVVAAVAPLALALSLDLGVIVYRLSGSPAVAEGVGASALAVLLGLWYAFPLVARAVRRGAGRAPAHA